MKPDETTLLILGTLYVHALNHWDWDVICGLKHLAAEYGYELWELHPAIRPTESEAS